MDDLTIFVQSNTKLGCVTYGTRCLDQQVQRKRQVPMIRMVDSYVSIIIAYNQSIMKEWSLFFNNELICSND